MGGETCHLKLQLLYFGLAASSYTTCSYTHRVSSPCISPAVQIKFHRIIKINTFLTIISCIKNVPSPASEIKISVPLQCVLEENIVIWLLLIYLIQIN